jgi:regulator of RNase E activity RraA
VNTPIAIGGIPVMPGDIVLGDQDGIIIIPKNDAAALIEKAEANAEADSAKVQKASTGSADRSWVDRTLEAKKVEFIDEEFSY